jgi:hypothetical protein
MLKNLIISSLVLVSLISFLTFAFALDDLDPTLKNNGQAAISVPAGPSLVSVNGRQLIVRKRNTDGNLALPAPYIIRGVVWSPASADTNTSTQDPNNVPVRRAEFARNAATDIPLLSQMNVNTVYLPLDPTLDAVGTAVLDQLYNNGIMAIITVDEGINNTSRVQQSVNFFKNHPAVLAWMLGNEWNINLYHGVASDRANAAARTQAAADLIKTLDLNHPVATSYGDIDIPSRGQPLSETQGYVNSTCSSVDIWGLNIFRGNSFGTLFEQWRLMTNKPMFIGEFGTDAFRSFNVGPNPPGIVDEMLQAQWTLSEWNHLFNGLSARHPARVAVGGFVHEFNDEWWKVRPQDGGTYDHQESGGCAPPDCPNNPDFFLNEEYAGIVNITRQPRAIYGAFTGAYSPAYQTTNIRTYRALSRGFPTQEFPFQNGVARFYDSGIRFYERTGGAGGGRGFNVAAIDPCTGKLLQPVRNFDTWSDSSGANMNAMIAFLNSLPNGTIILISVADEAGLTTDPCTPLNHPWTQAGLQTLQNLGSQHIDKYCYWNSWAMAVVKGQGLVSPDQEQLGVGTEASANITAAIQAGIFPARRSFGYSTGSGTISVTAPGTCNWTAVSDNPEFITITSGGSGTGNGTVTYSVASNSGGVRAGTLTIAGRTFTLGQAQQNLTGNENTLFDFDGDGKTDLSIFRPSIGIWWYLRSTDGADRVYQFGSGTDKLAPADFTGDGKSDIAFWRPSTGEWFVLRSEDNAFYAFTFGASGDIPAPGDFDGDGKADAAVFRPSNATWFILKSAGGVGIQQFGANGDVPTVADYDGDGKADIGIYRPSLGQWWIQRSTAGLLAFQFGAAGDKAVPGDYTGDGKTDIAIWRPSTGEWFVLASETFGVYAFPFGANGDIPAPGDYDGDGKTDAAIFRPSTGTWFVQRSTAGVMITQFGSNNDKPVPAAFIP